MFTKNDLKVETLGHLIGLHSQSSNNAREFSYKEQRNEYETNLSSLSKF